MKSFGLSFSGAFRGVRACECGLRVVLSVVCCLLVAPAVVSGCALVREPVPRTVLALDAAKGNSRNSEGDFVVLNDGRIFFAYSRFIGGGGDDNDRCVIAARTSSDKGETWSGDRIVARNEIDPKGNVMSVSLLRLRDGRLAMFYVCKTVAANGKLSSKKLMRVSADEGESWGAARDITSAFPSAYRVLNNARVIRLSSGRILVPLSEHANENRNELNHHGRIICVYSDDDGWTWKMSAAVPQLKDVKGRDVIYQEPGVLELKDGRVLVWFRTDAGWQWYSYSSDGGATWGEPTASSLRSPLSPASIFRRKSGDLICFWNDHEGLADLQGKGPEWACGVRTPLTVGISTDEGLTWRRRNLETGYDAKNPYRYWYCYTAMLELDDRILAAYCAENSLHDLRIKSIPHSWLP